MSDCGDTLKTSEHAIPTAPKPKLFALWDALLALAHRDMTESDQEGG